MYKEIYQSSKFLYLLKIFFYILNLNFLLVGFKAYQPLSGHLMLN